MGYPHLTRCQIKMTNQNVFEIFISKSIKSILDSSDKVITTDSNQWWILEENAKWNYHANCKNQIEHFWNATKILK